MAVDFKNLENLNLGDLNKKGSPTSTGEPLTLDLDTIDEDTSQPRTEFDQDELRTLADDIKQRGVMSPISVRETEEGRYLINFGARRYRASRLAGLTTIKAFIDNTFLPGFNQLAENIHRADHTPMEIANAIQQKLSEGMSKKDIAAALSKKESYITNHLALLEMPFLLKRAYEMGLVKDPQTIYLATRLCKEAGTDNFIGTFISTETPISRKSIQDQRDKIKVEKENQKRAKEAVVGDTEEDKELNNEIVFEDQPDSNTVETPAVTNLDEKEEPSDENQKLFELYDKKNSTVDDRYMLNVHHQEHGECYLFLTDLPFGKDSLPDENTNQSEVEIFKTEPNKWSKTVPLSELTIISVDIVDA